MNAKRLSNLTFYHPHHVLPPINIELINSYRGLRKISFKDKNKLVGEMMKIMEGTRRNAL